MMDISVELEEPKEGFCCGRYSENIEEPMTPENIRDNADMSTFVEDLNANVDKNVSISNFNDDGIAQISLNVLESELDILNEYSSDEELVNNEIDDETVGVESVPNNMKDGKKKSKSQLHCAICNNYFERPKLLICLHTFCQACLKKEMKSHHKYIFCHICRRKCKIPKGGIDKLTDNVLVASLVKGMSQKEEACVICKLHNEVKACAGMCVDCGDTLCDDCCQKHTFSRLTAKHVVISLEQMESGQYAKSFQKEEQVSCWKHVDENGEYFCTVCREPVCKECTLTEHRSHKCDLLEEAIAGKKKFLKEKFDMFKQECESKLVDDTDEAMILIEGHKKKEFEKLKNGKDALMKIIEQKYSQCAERLKFEFDIKERKYCDHKKRRLEYLSSDVENLTESINFIVNEGDDVHIAILENTIMNALKDKVSQLKKLGPKLTEKSLFPEVRLFKEHAKVLEGLTFFSTGHIYREQKRIDQEERMARSRMHAENGEIRMKLGGKFCTESNKERTNQHKTQSHYIMSDNTMQNTGSFQSVTNTASLIDNDRNPPSLLSLAVTPLKQSRGMGAPLMTSPPIGRGSILKTCSPVGRGSILKTGPENKSSLLGEYTGQSRQSLMDVISNTSSQCQVSSFISKRPKNREQNLMGRSAILDLSTSLDTLLIMDGKTPSNVDVVFMSTQNFAVADIKNHRLKIFNINGKLIKYIDDPSPMSVAFCANHLLWSSQFSFIKLFDIQSQEIVRVHRVPQMAAHPLTSFMNVKYLIGNMDQYQVDAFNMDGMVAHSMRPRDKYGVPLRDILHIAARSSNQLVCVDRQLRKVVVNDFDGNFVGEFSQDGFEPGGVCITEHDNIFVTDRNRNKLLLLSAKAEFIQDWNTVIDSPSSAASNLNGLLLVAGNTRAVSVYQYSAV